MALYRRSLVLLALVLSALAVAAPARLAAAQSFFDNFDDNEMLEFWEVSDASDYGAILEANARLEYSTTATTDQTTKKYSGYVSNNWSIRTTSDFYARVKVHSSLSGVSATVGSAQSLCFGLWKLGQPSNDDGFPGQAKLFQLGARRIDNGSGSSVYRWLSYGTFGATETASRSWYATSSSPTLFYDYATGVPAFNAPYDVTLYLRYATATDTLYFSLSSYNGPFLMSVANFTGGAKYPVGMTLGGYAAYPGSLSGADANLDSLYVDSAQIDAAPVSLAASDGDFGTKVRTTWLAAPNAVGYKVYRASGGGAPELLATLGQSALAYDDTTAVRLTQYTYTVQTLTSLGDGFSSSDDGWRNIDTPTNVEASDWLFSDKVQVTWDAVTDAVGYTVWRAVGTAAPTMIGTISSGSTTSYDDTTASVGTTYVYSVKAVSILGATGLSATDQGIRAPYPPTGLAATQGDYSQKVRLTWTAVGGASSYKVYRGADSGSLAYLATVTGGTSSFYDDTSAVALQSYFYGVTSITGTTESSVGDAVLGWRNLAPPVLTGSLGTSTTAVNLSWPAITGATGYTILRASGGGASTEIANGVSGTTYADVDADPLVNYSYTARAEHPLGVSAVSTPASGWMNVPAPANVAASDGDFGNRVTVTWSAVSGASGYSVWRKITSSAAAATQIGSVTNGVTVSYNDTTAAIGTNYLYSVRANHALGVTAFSDTDSGWRSTPAPATIAATDGTHPDKVRVTWSTATGATGYKVYRSVGGGDAALVATLTGAGTLAYDDTTAAQTTSYSYTVRSTSASGDGPSSTADTGWRNLPTPTSVAASDGTFDDRVRVTWAPVAGATGYRVFRKLGTAAAAEIAAVSGQGSSEYDDTSAQVAKSYSYTVKAVSALGDSAASLADAGIRSPVAPQGVLAADGTSTTGVRVSWSLSSGATGYKVYRRTEGGTAVFLKSVGSTATFYDDKTAVALTSYLYSVVATATGATSEASDEDSGWRNIGAPTLTASLGTSASAVNLSWTAVTGATGYRIIRQSGGQSAEDVAEVGAITSYADTTASPLVSYQYTVRSTHALGESASSAGKSGWMNIVGPGPIEATDGEYASKVVITWPAVDGATGYSVWRKTTSSAAAATQIASITNPATLEWNDTTAGTAVGLTYFVKSKHALGDSLAGETDTGWRNTTAPAAIAATDGTYADKVRVTWNASASATGYKVYRNLPGDTPTLIGTLATISPRTYDDTTAEPAVSYEYTVAAVVALGESAKGAANAGWRNVTTPTDVAASDGSFDDRVRVTWTASASATGYRVFRKIGAAAAVEIGTVSEGEPTRFDDSTIAVATVATYTVQPTTALGNATASTGNTGWRNRPAPANVAATDGTYPDKVVVTWDAVTSATGYRVYRQIGEGTNDLIGTTTASVRTFNDVSIAVGQTGSYTVTAIQSLGATLPSTADTGFRSPGFAGAGMDGGDAGGPGTHGPIVVAGPGSGPRKPDGDSTSSTDANDGANDGAGSDDTTDTTDDDSGAGSGAFPSCTDVLTRIAELVALETDPTMADALAALANGESPLACTMLAGDVNLDGAIDGADLVAFLAGMAAGDLLAADIDRDGAITAHDLAIVMTRIAEAPAS